MSDQRVLADFELATAHEHASPVEAKALYEAGIVESGLTNPHHGDGDSVGSLQERTSIYGRGHALSPKASATRFLRDARKLKRKGMSAGELAQAVQRSAFPGRYDQHSAEADQLAGHGGSSSSTSPHGRAAVAPRYVKGQTTPDTDGAVISALLDHKHGGSLLQRVQSAIDSGQFTKTTSGKFVGGHPATSSSTSAGQHHGKYDVLEEFWQGPGGIDIKNGKVVPQGFVEGHTDHVHVASGPKQVIALGKLAQRMGLHVGENPAFGGVNPVHATHSYHYRRQAIDVSGPAEKMRAYAHKVAALRKAR